MKLVSKISSLVLMALFLIMETGIPVYKSMCCEHENHISVFFANNVCNNNKSASSCCGHMETPTNSDSCCSHEELSCFCTNKNKEQKTDKDCGNTKRDVAKLSIDMHYATSVVNIYDISPAVLAIPEWNLSEFACLSDNIADKGESDRDNNLTPYNYGRKMKIFLKQLSISPRPC
ncbi:MAG: hypothetical protein ACK5IQ_01500 [Bacteroidales bacterium]